MEVALSTPLTNASHEPSPRSPSRRLPPKRTKNLAGGPWMVLIAITVPARAALVETPKMVVRHPVRDAVVTVGQVR